MESHLLVVDHVVVPVGHLEALLRLLLPLLEVAQVRVGAGGRDGCEEALGQVQPSYLLPHILGLVAHLGLRMDINFNSGSGIIKVPIV